MAQISVVGLGYVGLPLTVVFAEAGHEVTGYDVDSRKVEKLDRGIDPTGEIGSDRIQGAGVAFTDDPSCMQECDYVLVAVPTPIDDEKTPDLRILEEAAREIGRNLGHGTTVVVESTVYPGAIRQVVIPVLEAASNMRAGEDFFVGHSPERIVPGDPVQTLENVTKIVSGLTESTLQRLEALYDDAITSGVYPARSLEVAEAAKCLENVQRDVNIALVNEFAMGWSDLQTDIEATEVLDAAASKWNFHEYHPGLVGGHCIPVDPYLLIHAFDQHGFSPSLIRQAREVNDGFASHVAHVTFDALERRQSPLENVGGGNKRAGTVAGGQRPEKPTVLVLGLAYKANTADIRNSGARILIEELSTYDVKPVGFDPNVDHRRIESTFGISAQEELSPSGVEAVIVATPHDDFREIDLEWLHDEMAPEPVLVDVEGMIGENRATETGFHYRSLG